MSEQAELHLLKQRVAELEETVEIIDRGMSKKESTLRDRLACAFAAAGVTPIRIYEYADQALEWRGK